MYNKPLHGLNKENITKILNPKLKSNTTIPRSILENSNYENIKSHLPSTLLELSTKSPYDRITNQNRESNDNSTIPSKITINKPLDYNRFTITTSIPSSHNTTQAKATSIPLKSNYF